jgi:hypothetical protein
MPPEKFVDQPRKEEMDSPERKKYEREKREPKIQ